MSPGRRLGGRDSGGGPVEHRARRLGWPFAEGGDPVIDCDCMKGLRL